jgi:DNA-binding SARP family transcriptional activator
MVPVLEIRVRGEGVELRTMAAKLLLALLIARPDPLHVEQAVDLLWPDADVDVGRRRLNTVVHRLRASLGLPASTLRRVGDVLLLDVSGWDVDLFRLDPDEPVAGNLCHVQFPYDDLFVERREVIEGQLADARARRRPSG